MEDIWVNRDDDESPSGSQVKEASELEKLLIKNSTGFITEAEYGRAQYLILNMENGEKDCSLCVSASPRDVSKALEGMDYCSGHAFYLLTTGK
jgi:hypothetical protein